MSGPRSAGEIEADLDVANAAVSIGHRGSPALAAALQAELDAHDAVLADLRDGGDGDLADRFYAECAVALAVGFEAGAVAEAEDAPVGPETGDPGDASSEDTGGPDAGAGAESQADGDQGGSADATAGETVPSGTTEPAPGEFPDEVPWTDPTPHEATGGDAPPADPPAVPSVGPDPS